MTQINRIYTVSLYIHRSSTKALSFPLLLEKPALSIVEGARERRFKILP
jgi:hypothetical protein